MTEEFKRRAKNFLLLDIETVSSFASYDELPERMQKLWDKKALTFRKGDDETSNAAYFYDRGAIYSEFGRSFALPLARFIGMRKTKFRLKSAAFPATMRLISSCNSRH